MAANARTVDLYGELEVQATDDLATIKKSYRRLVLKYHPDKNPEDRSTAEEKIRKINAAYETLSVPAKRQQYDMQMNSMTTRKSGFYIDTTLVQPRFAIPKSFMMCPMGHPDKFVRVDGTKLVVQSRADVSHLDFDAFFQAAKFKLWWMKREDANNLCRLLVCDSTVTGIQLFNIHTIMGGGTGRPPPNFNLSFNLSMHSAAADVTVSPLEQPTTTNVIAQVSPEYPGAFRFEAAYFAGCHIAFVPPDSVQMMRRDQSSTIDFMLLDYGSAELHRTLDEILVPVVLELGGHMTAIKLIDVCKHRRIAKYFREIMCGELWDFTDFSLHFHAHDDKWLYDERTRMLKLRSLEEQVARSLKRSRTATEAVRALSKKADCDLCSLPHESLAVGLQMLSGVASKPMRQFTDAQITLLTTLKQMCARADRRSTHALLQLATLWDSLTSFAEKDFGADVADLVSLNKDAIVDLTSHMLQLEDTIFDVKLLELVLRMPLDWDKYGETLSRKGQRSITQLPLEKIVPLIRTAASAKVVAFGECMASSSMMKLFGVDAAVALEALDAMVSGGFGLEGVPMMLPTFLPKASPDLAARIIAGLLERNVSGPSFDACWQAVVLKESVLAALPADVRDRLKESRERSRSREHRKHDTD